MGFWKDPNISFRGVQTCVPISGNTNRVSDHENGATVGNSGCRRVVSRAVVVGEAAQFLRRKRQRSSGHNGRWLGGNQCLAHPVCCDKSQLEAEAGAIENGECVARACALRVRPRVRTARAPARVRARATAAARTPAGQVCWVRLDATSI
jgi:hypothetical protein